MKNFIRQICPRCGVGRLKNYRELNHEEKIVIERLPAAQQFEKTERERHLFCPNCWFETPEQPKNV